MAVAFDAVGPAGGGGASSATSPLTWTHVNGGSATSIVIGVTTFTGASNAVTAVTYGGTSCSLLGFVASGGSNLGGIALYILDSPPTGSNTVSVTFTGGNNTIGGSISFTGSSSHGTAATGTANATSVSVSVSGTTTGGMVTAAACFGGTGLSTFSGTNGVTVQWQKPGSGSTGADNGCGGTVASTGGGASQTVGFSDTGADFWGIVAVEVLPPAGGGVTFVPPRALPGVPPGMAPWLQRDRRDANTVATAANPLPSPLDTAWQADARYWHLYGDSALRDRRAYFAQRPLVSDPNLLAGTPADPLALNPEQSSSSDLWRVAAVPAFYDRREMPQQRQYYDVSLLATAELENELLGGAGTAMRYGFPAYYDRREVPQQPARLADPLLIGTAELEGNLLGASDTARHYLAAAYYDRREVPQQRLYISDPSAYPPQNNLDPLLTGQGLLDGHQHQAATHYDRREVPQQRLYISDPSFYPTGAATDPLTVAWGDGGNYWHLYNRAADITDRREYFYQRLYQSDPLLLATALLENELLGGGDTGRHWLAAAYQDRREVPQQRPYISDPSFYPTSAPTDPLTVAWGAGGPYWHLYNRAAGIADRREVPQQRAYVSDPLLLATAELENELLGGAGTAMRYLAPATHADRRQAGQQRGYPAAADIPFNPVLAAWADSLRRVLLAATHADRREVPQQRLYWPLPAPPPPFTIGVLTAADTARNVLTAAGASSILTAGSAAAATLTATDQRTGGPN